LFRGNARQLGFGFPTQAYFHAVSLGCQRTPVKETPVL
jgi:hypothetical protein